jgi:uroporphyrin-III C-methyltransferase / precorrin-2 dehydrogenase / sirohydrochlorin ferrochelatase
MSGFVWLVGAGPGDPDLLTRRAVRCLEAADLVLYDALVQPGTLALAPHAQCFSVGKRAAPRDRMAIAARGDRPNSLRAIPKPAMAQETIHFLMIRAARRGKRVVRLKGGDPFVFGRGGEEALALAAAGVPFEVVPGISSAVAAPALAGIPVTHRGLASGFVVVSGHAEVAYRPVLESLAPRSATVVVLMGLATRAAVASLLLARGWPAATPAAIVFDASGPAQDVWRGTLATLGTAPGTEDSSPGTLVVGDVVSLSSTIADTAVTVDCQLSTVDSIRSRR